MAKVALYIKSTECFLTIKQQNIYTPRRVNTTSRMGIPKYEKEYKNSNRRDDRAGYVTRGDG
ncbi:hypothetical protein KATP_02810 [Kluyvera ascorbata]|nr:hypothetical protein KATP_02810 [Kluyvera ascorbata]